ncbi:hypothetical protein HY449_01110 [Candidatus Pacearchaeota archaeon]|nr:hypothetical protein [Candidatus Pacearchaeota archaeon]
MNFIEFVEKIALIFSVFVIVLIWFTEFKIKEFSEKYSLRTYSLFVLLVISLMTSFTFLMRNSFKILKSFTGDISYLNNYFGLGLGIALLTLSLGYLSKTTRRRRVA